MAGAPPVYLNRIATRVPSTEMHGRFLEILPSLLKDERDRRIFARLIHKAQIATRYTVLEPTSFYRLGEFPSTAQRMDVFESESIRLAEAAVGEVLEREIPESITNLIVTTCTGFSAPGLDLEIQRRFGLVSHLERTVIGFMGCHAAFNGLKHAWHVVRSNPHARVLMVNLELCSLHFQDAIQQPDGRCDFETLLGFLQFADGCSASLVSADSIGLKLDEFRCEVLSQERDLIQWHVGNTGFKMRLGLGVPAVLNRYLKESRQRNRTAMSDWLGDEPRSSVGRWAIHPGGRAILDSVQESLDLTNDELRPSRDVLRDYGNMSSATIMFVLKNFLSGSGHRSGEHAGIAMAFGPGLTLEAMRFIQTPS